MLRNHKLKVSLKGCKTSPYINKLPRMAAVSKVGNIQIFLLKFK